MRTGEAKLFIGILVIAIVLVGFATVPTLFGPKRPPIVAGPQATPHTVKTLVPPGSHTVGNPKAPFTLVEFSDYQCASCGMAVTELDKLLKERKDQLRVVYHNLQVKPEHSLVPLLARAAEAAGFQGKFYEMHKAIFKQQNEFQGKDGRAAEKLVTKIAGRLGLDLLRFQADLHGDAAGDAYVRDEKLARTIGVNETPSFFFLTPSNQNKRFYTYPALRDYLKNPSNWR